MLYRNKMRLTLRKQADFLETGTYDAIGPNGTERRCSERIFLDVTVIVRGESTDSQPFQEETFAISVSAQGALLMLASKVTIGQTLLVRNPLTNNEKPARVARFGVPYGGVAQVGVEFLEPAAEFWLGGVPSNG
jgi:hypothetical protein